MKCRKTQYGVNRNAIYKVQYELRYFDDAYKRHKSYQRNKTEECEDLLLKQQRDIHHQDLSVDVAKTRACLMNAYVFNSSHIYEVYLTALCYLRRRHETKSRMC